MVSNGLLPPFIHIDIRVLKLWIRQHIAARHICHIISLFCFILPYRPDVRHPVCRPSFPQIHPRQRSLLEKNFKPFAKRGAEGRLLLEIRNLLRMQQVEMGDKASALSSQFSGAVTLIKEISRTINVRDISFRPCLFCDKFIGFAIS